MNNEQGPTGRTAARDAVAWLVTAWLAACFTTTAICTLGACAGTVFRVVVS